MLLVKSNFLRYCDVHEHGKLGISVTTSLFMTLVMVLFGSINTDISESKLLFICQRK